MNNQCNLTKIKRIKKKNIVQVASRRKQKGWRETYKRREEERD
jgi:hypothetical protein